MQLFKELLSTYTYKHTRINISVWCGIVSGNIFVSASRHAAKLEEELRAARLEIEQLRAELSALQVSFEIVSVLSNCPMAQGKEREADKKSNC